MQNTVAPDVKIPIIRPNDSERTFDEFSQRLVEKVREQGSAIMGIFNGTKIVVNPGDTSEIVYTVFQNWWNEPWKAEKHAKYLASTQWMYDAEMEVLEKETALKKRNINERVYQKLLTDLWEMDYTDMETVLNWFHLFENIERSIESEEIRKEIIDVFMEHGYESNMNKNDWKSDNRDDAAKFIIGESLYQIKKYWTLHQVVPTWIARWRTKFVVA